MGIYIKGMEMPHDCDECRLCAFIPVGDYGIHRKCLPLNANAEITIRRANCPLIELPPHGPLIDMDDFLQEWSELESYRTAMALCEVIEAEPPESCGDCNHYCTGQFFNNEEICMVTGDNAPYDISDCPLRKKEEGRE